MKIQQHCYTRAARGLFRQSEGYDTVARSEGLSEAFIKERLYPFCFYHPSRIMQAKRVPAEEFPRAHTVIQFPNNLMLISQTIYVESDFTGQRHTFFTHNFVLLRPENFSPALLNRLHFATSSDWDQLPELDELPLIEEDIDEILAGPLPFDGYRLRQLAYVLLEAVVGVKKVYVVLPGLDWTIPMLMWIYNRLPAAALQHLGFTTYSREPLNMKFLHLVFVENGALEQKDIEYGYVFDFDTGYFSENLPDIAEEVLEERIDNFSIPEEEEEEEEIVKAPKQNVLKRISKAFKR